MPEGDTVWRTAHHLDAALSGQVLRGSDFRVPSLATVDLAGRTVVETRARGKHLLTRIDGDEPLTLHTHLKMEGAWHLYRTGARWKRPGFEARVVLETDERVAVGFALGIVELVPTRDEDRIVGHLGPDLLAEAVDLAEAERRILAAPEREIAPALLDQRNVAGIGNLYANELCFLHGIDPRTPVRAVPNLRKLLDRAKRALEVNKLRPEQTTTGDLRSGRRTWVYGRGGEPCRRCGATIAVTRLGPALQERITFSCPRCQRLLG